MSWDHLNAVDFAESQRRPAVTIGLPAYNGAKYIRQALDSVLAQTFTDFELIISDNASTDTTEAICREYASRDQRIRYTRQEANLGGLPNFRYVLDQAAAEYFSWVAHDDTLLPDFIATTYDFLRASPSHVAVSGDFEALDENDEVITVKTLEHIRSNIPWRVRACEFYRYPVSNVFFIIYGLIGTEALKVALSTARRGPLFAASELPLMARLAALGQIASVPQVLRVYRYHEASVFQTEKANLAKTPVRACLLRTYNIWWKRWDQFLVLVHARVNWRHKLFILASTLAFYLRYGANELLRIPRRIVGTLLRQPLRSLTLPKPTPAGVNGKTPGNAETGPTQMP